MALMTGDSLYWKTKIDNTGLTAGATQAKGIIRGLARSITGMDIFAGLAIGATLAFTKITKEIYKFSKEFETAMKEVQTISKAVENNYKGISEEIIEMTKTVPDNALKLTKALYQIVSAGYDGAKAMDILRVSTELAVATVTDTFNAADVLTYVMNAYGRAAGTAAEISDKLFTIIRLGKVRMDELSSSLSMVTGLAAQVGLTFNELAAMYAEAVKKMQPRIVSTGIRGIITAMLRVSEGTGDAADKARELGIEFDITALKSKGFKQILSEIIAATKGNEAALMSLFPNVRGLIGLLAIMTDEGEGFNRTLAEIENSLGATGKAFKTMMDTTENQWAILRNNVMAKMKPLGDYILGFMNDIASGINIAMSGANDELSRLAKTYSDLTDTLQRKKGRIDDLITTIETLKDKTKLTKEETRDLKIAEESLMILLPNLGRAAEDAGASFDILTAAKRGSLELDISIIESKLVIMDLEKDEAGRELARIKRNEDEHNKEIVRLKEKEKFLYERMAKEGMFLIDEFFRLMREEPLDGFTEQIDEILRIYGKAGTIVRNLGERLLDIQKDQKMGMDTTIEQEKIRKEIFAAMLRASDVYQNTLDERATSTANVTKREAELNLELDESTIRINTLTDTLRKLKELREKPIITLKPKPGKPPEEPTVISILTDEQIEAVEDNLKYMAGQYKRYLNDIAEFGKEYVEENNALLFKEGSNYSKFLSDMLIEYKGNADLTRQITDDIYEYNKGILARRKETEEELFNFLAEAREKDLAAEKDKFETIIKNYKEGTEEYKAAMIKHEKNMLKIKTDYAEKEAKLKLDILKVNLERQTGEERKAYKIRLEAEKIALGKKTKLNKEHFKFIEDKLYEIAEIEKAIAEENRETLDSYLAAYKTTEEKIVAIKKLTTKLLKYTDDEYERSKLKSIEKIEIAEIKSNEARQEITDRLARYGERLNNQELEDYINFLEEMKIKYSDFADAVILLNEKIADSQKQIWENTRDEINQTVDLLHNLAGVVGDFDTELGQMINSVANLVSGVGQLLTGFATGNIFGIIGGIISGISAFFNLFTVHHSDVAEIEEELHQITLELQEQQDILSLAIGTEKPEAIQNIIDLLYEQINVYNEMIEAEQEAYGQFLWWTWSETDQANIEQWLSSIQNINTEIANLNQQYQEILTGTTASAIANAIAEGFAQGLDSAQIFADTFNEMMKKAIIDAFKASIVTGKIQRWYELFARLSEGGLTVEEIERLAGFYQYIIAQAEAQWQAVVEILDAVGIDLIEPEETIEEIIEQAKEAIESIAGMTQETIADSIAEGFSEGLSSAEVFADTFKDMMQRAVIGAFKEAIIAKYIQGWYEQFAMFYEGGLTAQEIQALTGTYQALVSAAETQWETMEAVLEAAGLGFEEARRTGLRGAIAGITEETAGLLAGQFQAIRINTVEIISNMEDIIIINARIADNTEYNRYLEHISNKMDEGGSLMSEYLRSVGGG